jgi:hypothetical protein
MMGSVVQDAGVADVVAHLGFLGFDADVRGNTAMVRHATRANMVIEQGPVGLMHRAAYGIQPDRSDDLGALHRLCNAANERALLLRFYVGPEQATLMIEALYLGEYDQRSYSTFLDLWERDLQRALATPEAGELLA